MTKQNIQLVFFFLIFFGFLLFVPFNSFSQTVMAGTLVETVEWIFSSEDTGSDSPSVITQEILRNLETGIMDSLFDQGFICFNLDPEIKNDPLTEIHVSQILFHAQSGGANQTLLFKGSARINRQVGAANQQLTISGQLLYLDAQGRELGSLFIGDITRSNALQLSQQRTRELLQRVARVF